MSRAASGGASCPLKARNPHNRFPRVISTSRATARVFFSPPTAKASFASSLIWNLQRASSTISAKAETGTSNRSRCHRMDVRSPSSRTKPALACCGCTTRRRGKRSRGRRSLSVAHGVSSGTRTHAISPFRSTVRKVRAMSTRSTCGRTASRAGRKARSPVSTRRSFAVPSRSNGKPSTAARLAASSSGRPQNSLERGRSSYRSTAGRKPRRGPDSSDVGTTSSTSSASRSSSPMYAVPRATGKRLSRSTTA